MSIRRIGVRRSDKPDAADRSACRQDRSCCGSRNALGVSGEIHGNAGTTTATRQPRISAERCGVVRHDRRYGQRRSCLRSSTSHKEARTEADDALGDATRPCSATCPFNKSPLLIASASLYYQLAAFRFGNATTQNVVSNTNDIFSAEVPTITMSSSAENMSERGDIWLSRGFSVTCIVSAFIGALMVGMLLGEPDILMLFGAVGGVMVGAVFYFVVAGIIRLLF